MRTIAAAAALFLFAACNDTGAPGANQPGTPSAPAVPMPSADAIAAMAAQLPPAMPLAPAPAFLGEVKSPADNPLTPEKAQLGRMLFFDKRISKDGSMACAECHHLDKAYTDGRALSPKVGGALNKRNAPTMANLGLHEHGYYWDGRKGTLEAVSEAAWTGQLGADMPTVVAKLNANITYRTYFNRAFKSDATNANVSQALASFFRALTSGNSAWDQFEKGDKNAVSAEAQKGFEVFRDKGCAQCHVPPLYSDTDFHNVGIGSELPAEKRDHGRMDATKDAKDDGKFKTPSLRDVAKTGPYFHDGSAASLSAAIDKMLAAGAGAAGVDEKLKPQTLTAMEKVELTAFLVSLTGRLSFSDAPPLPSN